MPKKTKKVSKYPLAISLPEEVNEQVVTMATKAGITRNEVVEQLIWGYLDHMEAAWERGEPIPPRPWRDLPMPKKPRDPRPTTDPTPEASALSAFLEGGEFPEVPEPTVQPVQEPPVEMPVPDEGSTRVRRRRTG